MAEVASALRRGDIVVFRDTDWENTFDEDSDSYVCVVAGPVEGKDADRLVYVWYYSSIEKKTSDRSATGAVKYMTKIGNVQELGVEL